MEQSQSQHDANTEIIEGIARIEELATATKRLAEKTNGRVTALEGWRNTTTGETTDYRHATTQTLVELTSSIEKMRGEMAATLAACTVSPTAIEAAVGKALDSRSLMDDANRWRAVVSGAQAIGWKVATGIALTVASGLLAALVSLWLA